jgi:hypothetical protein
MEFIQTLDEQKLYSKEDIQQARDHFEANQILQNEVQRLRTVSGRLVSLYPTLVADYEAIIGLPDDVKQAISFIKAATE